MHGFGIKFDKLSGCKFQYNIAIFNSSSPVKGEDGWDGSDMQWELYCEDCELVIAEGDGWDDPKEAYRDFIKQKDNQ